MAKPAVFLDRDGTINEQVGYVNHPDRFWLLAGAAQAIRRLNDASVPVFVVSNQAGAARGYFPEELIEVVNDKMRRLLDVEAGAHIDGLYFCPHHPSSALPHLAVDCTCRKPKTGMLEQAAADNDLDLCKSYVVGDRMGDVQLGHRVGAKGILVLTGYGKGENDFMKDTNPDYVADDLGRAVDWILEDMGG